MGPVTKKPVSSVANVPCEKLLLAFCYMLTSLLVSGSYKGEKSVKERRISKNCGERTKGSQGAVSEQIRKDVERSVKGWLG
jgi:hypothetical protein